MQIEEVKEGKADPQMDSAISGKASGCSFTQNYALQNDIMERGSSRAHFLSQMFIFTGLCAVQLESHQPDCFSKHVQGYKLIVD